MPATPGTLAWPPSLPSVPTSRATRVTSPAKRLSWSTIVFRVSFSCRISPRTSTVILRERSPLGDGGGHLGDVAHLGGQIAGHGVHAVGQVFPGARDAGHLGLAAELAVGADLARHARHFGGEGVELVHHRVDGFLQQQDFAADIHRDLLRQVALAPPPSPLRRYCAPGRSGCYAIELTLSVRSFHVPATPRTIGLAAQLAFGADLARHARHFARRKR